MEFELVLKNELFELSVAAAHGKAVPRGGTALTDRPLDAGQALVFLFK
jgi:hypothetical protein